MAVLFTLAAACGGNDLEARKADARAAQTLEHGDHQPYRPPTEPEKIEALLDAVRGSELVFIRHGREMSPQEAATRLQRRYERHGDKIRTARDFAGRLAASGPMSGKPYLVRLHDGREVLARDWLIEQLAIIERPPARYVDHLGRDAVVLPPDGSPPPPAPRQPVTVIELIEVVEASELTFLSWSLGGELRRRSGSEMAKMLRNKTTWLGPDLQEVDPWIDELGTRSFGSYHPYAVERADGTREPLAVWLRRAADRDTVLAQGGPESSPAARDLEGAQP